MNFFFLRSAWPSLTVETRSDWLDRVATTTLRAGKRKGRVWWFDTVLLSDRSAAFRGLECGERTQRTAAEAVNGVVKRAGRTGFLERGWWEPVRRNVLRFAGENERTLDVGTRAFMQAEHGTPPNGGVEEVVVTYISRQGVRRHLIPEDHEGLVHALVELCHRRGWELNVVAMERLSRDEQLALAARTTVSVCWDTHNRHLSLFLFFFFLLIHHFFLLLVPRRRPWKWTYASNHDAHNPDFDSH
jgi:hypothetical protein